ncbi:hypothetical protein BCS93_08845 [Vibrio breoganii]|uniref:SGNH domain-containing protein n=1 Tax=Vibrio breoganii TaxID=553239 RepID=A0AAP8SX21_9VIBR|nr:SGNH hydrolase domain-containing protein [Vibrio breoganii]PMP11309.1 hypothetical protein BCS93_08845 [Vibrio breoganii]
MFKNSIIQNDVNSVIIDKKHYLERNKLALKAQSHMEQCGVQVLDPTSVLCNDKYCFGDIDGSPLYFDDDHLSTFGAKVAASTFDSVFGE